VANFSMAMPDAGTCRTNVSPSGCAGFINCNENALKIYVGSVGLAYVAVPSLGQC
jgi:hypothetical protein